MSEQIALWFLFFAYTAVFVILFLVVGRLHSRASRLEKEVEHLEAAVSEEEKKKA